MIQIQKSDQLKLKLQAQELSFIFLKASLALVSLLTHRTGQTATIYEASNFERVTQIIGNILRGSSSLQEVLIAWDLDETLFIVQDCLNQGRPKKFIEMKKRIFNCETILTHDSVPDLIRQLQIQGLTNIGLTARRHTLITPTQRELQRWNIEFSSGHHLAPSGFSLPLPRSRISKNRKLVFENGVLCGHGYSKGEALKLFKEQVGYRWRVVIFVEDAASNVNDMLFSWKDHPTVKLHIIHYTKHAQWHFNPLAHKNHPNEIHRSQNRLTQDQVQGRGSTKPSCEKLFSESPEWKPFAS